MKRLYLILPLALIVCFMVSCQDKEAMAELEEFKAQAALEKQNIALVKRYIDEFNKGNVEILNEICAPDYRFYVPSNSPKFMSREEIVGTMKMFISAFPDFNWSIEDTIAEGDKVVTRFSMRGTHEGEWQGIPPTGNKVETSAIFITLIKNGKVVEDRDEENSLGFMMQLGMELKPKEEDK
jgi:steroid delta-isomerase-like uncharacterized protein